MSAGSPANLAVLARRTFLDVLRQGVGEAVAACEEGARDLACQLGDAIQGARRRDLVMALPQCAGAWREGLIHRLSNAVGRLDRRDLGSERLSAPVPLGGQFSLVDDSQVEVDLMVSRLAHVIQDRAGWEATDLGSRLSSMASKDEALLSQSRDVLKAESFARWAVEAWMDTPGASPSVLVERWKTWQPVLHPELALLAQAAYHEANRVLLEHGVKTDIDLRPFIRRSRDTGVIRSMMPSAEAQRMAQSAAGSSNAARQLTGSSNRVTGPGHLLAGGSLDEETRLLTATSGLRARGQEVVGQLNRLIQREVPDFDATRQSDGEHPGGPALTPALHEALVLAQRRVQIDAAEGSGGVPRPSELARLLQERKRELKKMASGPAERATIEIVALLFQSLLAEERLPALVRVWFARIQMPVLRVAVSEPDFFATVDHPARLLIDRMGSCVMGFVGSGSQRPDDDALHQEIKRIVQTIEAYPDTGRRVFQTVLTEFERFLVTYFREGNEASRQGVSLAHQLEQREAYAIQYTIELRKMLDGVPVHDGVRDFLFKVWADVLAHSAVQSSTSSAETRALKRLATGLIWSASAKTSREERNEVLQRLPPLLKDLRAGMTLAGVSAERQAEHLKALNDALAAAFAAKAASISTERLAEVTHRLEALDSLLPEMSDLEIDTEMVRDLSGYESDHLEVVDSGGTMATPAMAAWASELQLGAWFRLDYRDRQDSVQLAWRGLQKQLTLFVTDSGRGVLFQSHRLAAFLQAGLLLPLEEEALTVKATRDALAKLDADPQRLLN